MNAGIAGMNFAAFESPQTYHASVDTPEHLDLATLQHQGDLMLALTRQFGTVPLTDLKTEDRIFFDVPRFFELTSGLVVYR